MSVIVVLQITSVYCVPDIIEISYHLYKIQRNKKR